MSVTHAEIAAATTAAGLGTANPYVLLTAAIASQLPDMDTSESFSGRVFWPVTNFLEQRFPHRSLTHSFMATGAIALVVGAGVYYFGWPWIYWRAAVLGYFMGWFSDAFTKSGVEAFYLNPARLVIPGNPNARLSTHSPSEYWVLAISVLVLVASATAVENNLTLQIINERMAAIEERIDEARALNQDAVLIDTIEPLASRYLQFDPNTGHGFLNNLLGIFTSPITSINEILSLIGIPFLRNTTRTNARAQANADLQVKVSQIEADARKIDQAIREEVLYQVLEFDVIHREFQISQEVAQRAVLQHRLLEIDYRFSPDRVSTDTYLNHLSSLDQQKAQTYRAWAQLRTQLERIKILVLGVRFSLSSRKGLK